MKKLQGLIAVVIILMVASVAQAATIESWDTGLGAKLGSIGINSLSASDAVSPATYWSTSGTGSTTRLVLAADAIGSFGIFDTTDHSNTYEIFNENAVAGAYTSFAFEGNSIMAQDGQTILATFASGNSFGYYLTVGGITYYSDEAPDRMVAFKGGSGEIIHRSDLPSATWGTFNAEDYILAWDTNPFMSTYDDFIVFAESVDPSAVPEPSSLLLLGGGLIGLGFAGYRRLQNKQ